MLTRQEVKMRRATGMDWSVLAVELVTAFAAASCASAAIAKPVPFKVTHLTLYDNGVGQFERQAEVKGAEELEINLTLAHLDDLLSTLFVATDGSVKVSAIRYPAVSNMGQARSDSALGNALSDESGGVVLPTDLEGYVKAMTGSRVEVTTSDGSSAVGVIMTCVPGDVALAGALTTEKPGADGPGREQSAAVEAASPRLVLVSDDGALAWYPLSKLKSVAPVSQREKKAMAAFASQLGKANGFEEVSVRVQTAPGSSGRLAAGYVRQVPLWRMSYKVTAEEKGISLEAWAVVHNDTTEDWNDVHMTLVSGLPRSYVLSMSSPRYAPRDLLPLDDGTNLFPQLGAKTPDGLIYEWSVTEAVGYLSGAGYGYGGAALASRSSRSAAGFSLGSGGSGSYHAGEADSSLVKVGTAAAEEQAAAAVEGEISTYTALQPVSIPRRSSSMVPVMRRALDGEPFTLIGSGYGQETCVRTRNDSGLVLQSGVATFYIAGRFRGQAQIDRTEPGDVKVWCFGEDPDVSWTSKHEVTSALVAIEAVGSRLKRHDLRTTVTDYSVTNDAGQERRVAVAVSHRANGRIASPDGSTEGEGGQRLVMLTCPGRQTCSQRVVVEEGVMTEPQLDTRSLEPLAVAKELTDAQREVIARLMVLVGSAEDLDRKGSETSQRIQRLREALDRKRESLKSLPQVGGRYPALDKMLADILSAEEGIEALLEKKVILEEQAESQREKAREVVATLPKPPARP